MTWLVRGALGVVGVALALTVSAFLLPRHVEVARTIEIDAAPEAIFPFLNAMQRTSEWSPWLHLDPDVQVTYGGPDAGVGNRMAWTSDLEQVGSGTPGIVASVPGPVEHRGKPAAKREALVEGHGDVLGPHLLHEVRQEAGEAEKGIHRIAVAVDHVVGQREPGAEDVDAGVDQIEHWPADALRQASPCRRRWPGGGRAGARAAGWIAGCAPAGIPSGRPARAGPSGRCIPRSSA